MALLRPAREAQFSQLRRVDASRFGRRRPIEADQGIFTFSLTSIAIVSSPSFADGAVTRWAWNSPFATTPG